MQMQGQQAASVHQDKVALTYYAPPAHLADYFGAMYRFAVDADSVSDQTRADFAQIRLMFRGSGYYLFSDSTTATTPQSCLLGPTLGATRFVLNGPVDVLGVSVLPKGWAALNFGEAADVADSVMDLCVDPGGPWTDLAERCAATATPEAAADLLWQMLESQMQPVAQAECQFIETVDHWLLDDEWPRVGALVERTRLSDRQLARLCNRLYGAPARFLARKFRALRCAQQIARDGCDWSDCATDLFYDQSHFIRELKHFVGLTPVQLRDRASMLMQLTFRRRDVEGIGSNLHRLS